MGMRYPELSIVTRKRDLRDRRDVIAPLLAGVCRRRANDESATGRRRSRVIEKYIHVGSKAEAIKTYDYFVRSISDTLRTNRDGITEFLATLEAQGCRRNEAKSE